MTAPWRDSLVLLAILLAIVPACLAAERTHVVAPGESAAAIAKHYYGDHELASPLLRYNGRDGTVIRPGENLRIPYCETHVVAPGDSWSALARRFLGRADAYPAVAILNGVVPESPLRVNQKIVLPVVVPRALEKGDTLGLLADRVYGDFELGEMLQEFNGIEDPRRLSVGQTIEVPLVTLRLRDGLDAPPPEPTPPPPSPFEEKLRAARQEFRAGEFEAARQRLERMTDAVRTEGSEKDRAEHGRLLAFVYVAFDLPVEACEVFAESGEARRLDPDRISPKIRETLATCGS